jgi:hypothetical protein
MSECNVPTNTISILEKINRLTQLFDPWLMPIELVQFYAQNLGYDVGLNREQIPTLVNVDPEEAKIEQNKYLRFMVSQLPEWYKVKTTRPSLKTMLYSFGLVGDVVYYYTKTYSDGMGMVESGELTETDLINQQVIDTIQRSGYSTFREFYADVCKMKSNLDAIRESVSDDWLLTNWNPSSVQEDVSNIPDEYFPTPHFMLWFDVMESIGAQRYSTDIARNSQMATAIKAIKPLNTVFEGIAAWIKYDATVYMRGRVRFRKQISLSSDVPADQWNV